MKKTLRILGPLLTLAVALAVPLRAEAQLVATTAVGELRIPTVSAVGAGNTCQNAKDNALKELQEDYLIIGSVTYGPCTCGDIIDPLSGEYLGRICTVEISAMVFRKLIILTGA